MAIREASTDDGYGTRRHEDALRIARIMSTCTVERNDKEKTERNWNNKNNFFTFGARQLFLLFAFVSILHEVIIENKLGQFVLDIRKRIGIIGIYTETNWNNWNNMLTNWNNIYSHSGTELFSLFSFVSK